MLHLVILLLSLRQGIAIFSEKDFQDTSMKACNALTCSPNAASRKDEDLLVTIQ